MTDHIELPKVSIIIPCRNEQGHIGDCLRSIAAGEYPNNLMEILVSDGMSTDNTREEILNAAEETGLRISIIDNPDLTVPYGFNRALLQSSAEMIIRLDAHSIYEPDYISRLVELHSRTGADNVGGRAEAIPANNAPRAKTLNAVWNHWFGVGNSAFRTLTQPAEVDTVPFGCFSKNIFRKLGLFDERLERNQDYEFNQRIRQNGGHVYLDPKIIAQYRSRGNWISFFRYGLNNGMWNPLMAYLHPHTFRLRHFIPAFFVVNILLFMLSIPLTRSANSFNILFPVLFSPPLALYFLLDLVASIQVAKKEGWACVTRAPLAFFLFHSSHGLGIIHGMLRILTRRFPWSKSAGVPAWPQDT